MDSQTHSPKLRGAILHPLGTGQEQESHYASARSERLCRQGIEGCKATFLYSYNPRTVIDAPYVGVACSLCFRPDFDLLSASQKWPCWRIRILLHDSERLKDNILSISVIRNILSLKTSSLPFLLPKNRTMYCARIRIGRRCRVSRSSKFPIKPFNKFELCCFQATSSAQYIPPFSLTYTHFHSSFTS